MTGRHDRRLFAAGPRGFAALFPRGFAVALAAALGLSFAAAVAVAGNDMGLAVDAVERVGNAICVSYHADVPFTPRLEDPLLRGMPATVTFEVGVWKKRALWFDKLVVAYRSEHKVAFDPWSKTFRIRSGVNPPRTRSVANLDSLRATLFSVNRLPVAIVSTLDSTAAHYVSVKVVIRPLSADDLGEIEDWLSGSEPGESEDRGLPAYLLEWAVNLSGLGDRTALVKGPRFVPATLSPSR
ncbi:MAG TPA: DUF4390 domain-containing protein [Candidatus Eisenbacteria bacterium]|nr:DUF4390 domain-containing protein [Candidatus Eisenbacteria bacterium]